MTDLTDLPEGRWGISRIIEDEPRSFTTAAMLQGLGDCKAYYPPMTADKTGYTLPFAVVHFPNGITGTPDADTRLVPNRLLNTTLGELTVPQRNALQSNLEEWLTGYSYIDWDNTQQVKAAFSAAGYDGTTLLKRVLLDVMKHIGHSAYRPKPVLFESHNTEYTDEFGSDPTTRWTVELGGTPTWDSGNSELDFNTTGYAEHAYRYSANDPGSIEEEAQVTVARSATSTGRVAGPGVRWTSDGTNDGYGVTIANDDPILVTYLAGTRTNLSTYTGGLTWTSGYFHTTRLAASGTAGSNVVLDFWKYDHGSTSKPSDPGWIGVDGSPDHTYTDSGANRHDDSNDISCGIAGRGSGGSDYDTRHCYWKSRAISDRGGSTAAVDTDGTATATGVGSSIASSNIGATGAGTATAATATTASADLSSGGASTATAEASTLADGDADISSAGVSTATAEGRSLAGSDVTSAGVGTATAEASATADGEAAGYAAGASTATAEGAALGSSDVSADGESTATANTEEADTGHSTSRRHRMKMMRRKRAKLHAENRNARDDRDVDVILAAVRGYYRAAYRTGFPVE